MSGRHSLQAEYTKHNERDANTNTETNMPVRIRSFVVCSRARPTTRARHTESELSRKIEIVGWKRERKEKIGASTRARTKKYSRCVRACVRAYVRGQGTFRPHYVLSNRLGRSVTCAFESIGHEKKSLHRWEIIGDSLWTRTKRNEVIPDMNNR